MQHIQPTSSDQKFHHVAGVVSLHALCQYAFACSYVQNQHIHHPPIHHSHQLLHLHLHLLLANKQHMIVLEELYLAPPPVPVQMSLAVLMVLPNDPSMSLVIQKMLLHHHLLHAPLQKMLLKSQPRPALPSRHASQFESGATMSTALF